jgi:hypothetical protein
MAPAPVCSYTLLATYINAAQVSSSMPLRRAGEHHTAVTDITAAASTPAVRPSASERGPVKKPHALAEVTREER